MVEVNGFDLHVGRKHLERSALRLYDSGIVDGERKQARLIFRDRMLYQVMVSGPAKTFPAAEAQRFFSAFRLAPAS